MKMQTEIRPDIKIIRRRSIYKKYIKRPLDIILSLAASVVLLPVMLITSILVRVKLGSPVIFRQKRPGLNEKIFTLYKFRTMTEEKDDNGDLLPDSVRLTKFGKLLRSTSLDELPELINILKGDMSIIGPRPLLIQYLPYYTKQEKHRHDIRPGLSGLAQISGRNFLEWDQRLSKDIEYADSVTFLNDLRILIKTVLIVFKKEDIAPVTDDVEGNLADIRKSKGFKTDI